MIYYAKFAVIIVRLQALTAGYVHMIVFWVLTPRRFVGWH